MRYDIRENTNEEGWEMRDGNGNILQKDTSGYPLNQDEVVAVEECGYDGDGNWESA